MAAVNSKGLRTVTLPSRSCSAESRNREGLSARLARHRRRYFPNAVATGRPPFHVTTTYPGALNWSPTPWYVPVQRVWVGDVTVQVAVRALCRTVLPHGRSKRMFKVLPVKVPRMFLLSPSDGNEPAYRVGICACASAATANRTTAAVDAMARNISSSPSARTNTIGNHADSATMPDRPECCQGPRPPIGWEPQFPVAAECV